MKVCSRKELHDFSLNDLEERKNWILKEIEETESKKLFRNQLIDTLAVIDNKKWFNTETAVYELDLVFEEPKLH
ncbi:MAG: hypothetical protein ABH821_05390 [archaeon]